ncbi:MAG: hypothetical protein A3I73_06215 [Omnitrophica bacterium RIFCSPLOWO2_02_FULL_45_16]|nr:MAG: hypothetical protein A3G36_00210 [Omnitrophica bacterium RIFCSPLOWO2_12_FULL_45_13]OGW94542.1 MAG: hypothetical protein A3K16_01535 [Omnitrophica bacterium RIFCSPLOWO2_01_FULL_45_24]OGW99743.1 MAG: hypothetical protein A3I73_06215 [Omnitrophica bacterium RIFCSPLOWO2_02_FULL_45_16]
MLGIGPFKRAVSIFLPLILYFLYKVFKGREERILYPFAYFFRLLVIFQRDVSHAAAYFDTL